MTLGDWFEANERRQVLVQESFETDAEICHASSHPCQPQVPPVISVFDWVIVSAFILSRD